MNHATLLLDKTIEVLEKHPTEKELKQKIARLEGLLRWRNRQQEYLIDHMDSLPLKYCEQCEISKLESDMASDDQCADCAEIESEGHGPIDYEAEYGEVKK